MEILRKILLAALLVGITAVIIITWGSIGSAVLTLALLLSLGLLLLKFIMDRQDPDDFDWNG